MGELYTKTMQKEQHIASLGYQLITVWENEWHAALKYGKRAAEELMENPNRENIAIMAALAFINDR